MVDENDKKVFEMFSKGYTEGVFQFESQGMKKCSHSAKTGAN